MSNNIKGPAWDPLRIQQSTGRVVPQNVGADGRFRDILAMMQDDGLIAKDAAGQALVALTDEQKEMVRTGFDIDNMMAYAERRALLNELVSLGALSAEESELSLFQVMPPDSSTPVVGTGMAGVTGAFAAFDQTAKFDSMMSEPNYLRYLEQAIEFDKFYSRSDDVKNARVKVYDLLQGIFGG